MACVVIDRQSNRGGGSQGASTQERGPGAESAAWLPTSGATWSESSCTKPAFKMVPTRPRLQSFALSRGARHIFAEDGDAGIDYERR